MRRRKRRAAGNKRFRVSIGVDSNDVNDVNDDEEEEEAKNILPRAEKLLEKLLEKFYIKI